MLKTDFSKVTGKIKPMHAVGQPPFAGGFLSFDFSHIDWLTKANIPYSRLHDVGGVFGGNRFVDIPNLFRDFDADETDPESYDFSFTDELLREMVSRNVAPIFRLGVTIENQAHIKAYRINPPKDFEKWARICEHVIRHYNEGFANGFEYGIEYWEIWNEADNGIVGKNQMWTGTFEQYCELYTVTAKHLKATFGDKIKVGGYGATSLYGIYCEPEEFGSGLERVEVDDYMYEKSMFRTRCVTQFFEYIKEHNAPLDFFSWHSYRSTEQTAVMSDYLYRLMTKYGYGDVETHINEWNNAHNLRQHGSDEAAALAAQMLITMQGCKTGMLCYYDSRLGASSYGGMFNAYTQMPTPLYYVFKAFGELYRLSNQAWCECDIENVYALAAKDGDEKAVLITNVGDDADIVNADFADMDVYLVDTQHSLDKVDIDPQNFTLKKNHTVLLKNR